MKRRQTDSMERGQGGGVERLEERNAFFRAIMENVAIGIVAMADDGTVNSFNSEAEKIFGYRAAEIIGRNVSVFLPEPDRAGQGDRLASRSKPFIPGIAGMGPREAMGLHKNGYCFPVEIAASEMRTEDNACPDSESRSPGGMLERNAPRRRQFICIVRDITERKLAQEKLEKAIRVAEEARDKIDCILKSIGDGVLVTDVRNRLILMNRAAEDILNVRMSEAIDQPIDFFIKGPPQWKRIKASPDGYQMDLEFPGRGSGRFRVIRARTFSVSDDADRGKYIVTLLADVTREREMDRMKSNFITTVAHEFRAPMTSIQGFSEILLTRKDIRDEEKEKFLSYIFKQSRRLSSIVTDILDISQIESDQWILLKKVACGVRETIARAVAGFQGQFKDLQFEIACSPSLEWFVDKEKMDKVLSNLIGNAAKYSPNGGAIRITAEEAPDHFLVAVADNGVGMTPEQLEKIFEKFYRADSSNTATEGTGLGMTIVKYIVEAHGGRVWVESETGKGTTARFTAPKKAC